jgi:hypothetical protein
MKPKTFNFLPILFLLIIMSNIEVYSQPNNSPAKIKSLVVYEEKLDVLITKKVKESETTYDSRGNILEDIQYTDGKVDKHFTYQYDSSNNKIKETEFDPSGKVLKISEYKIENGLRTEKTVYDAKMKIKSKKTYVYTTF